MLRLKAAVRWRNQLVYRFVRLAPLDVAEVELRAPGPGEVEDVESLRGGAVAQAMRTRLAGEQIVLYAYASGRVIGHAACFRPFAAERTVNGYFQLPAGSALIHGCFVDPEIRGRGVFPQLLQAVVRVVNADHPGSEVLVDTSVSNTPSQRGIVRSGFELARRVEVLQFGRRPILVRTYEERRTTE